MIKNIRVSKKISKKYIMLNKIRLSRKKFKLLYKDLTIEKNKRI